MKLKIPQMCLGLVVILQSEDLINFSEGYLLISYNNFPLLKSDCLLEIKYFLT